MSLKFTDERLYVKGIGAAYLRDPSTGNVTYYSNKFSTGQFTPSADAGEITAGLGNTLATMIPTNARVNVNFTAADFDLFVKGSSVGATIEAGAPVPVCETVTAAGETLTVSKTLGTPIANVGMSNIICYVQEVSAPSPVAQGGVAYPIDPVSGTVSGFTATAGSNYKVTYFVSRANARMATIGSDMNGAVQHFTAEFAIYSNVNTNTLQGTRWGTLYAIVPNLKLMAEGSVLDGDQTSNTTTGIIGQALMYDETVVTDDCGDCGSGSTPLAYYLVVPCDNTSGLAGLAIVGGVISVPISSTHAITEFRVVTEGGDLVRPDPAFMSYVLTGAPDGTSVAGNVISTGATAGDCEIVATYSNGSQSLTCPANLSVTSA